MPPIDANWFDKKYQDGKRPTLADRTHLFHQIFASAGIKISDRVKKSLEKELKGCLFQLKKQYSPSLNVEAYGLLFCCAPLLDLDDEKYQGYVEQYREITERHGNEHDEHFRTNFNGD